METNHNYLARYYVEQLLYRYDTSDEIFYFMQEMKKDFKDFNQDKFTESLDELFMKLHNVLKEHENG